MPPSLMSALKLVLAVGAIAGFIGIVMGVAAEWGAIAGTLHLGGVGGVSFVLVVLVEAIIVLVIVALLAATTPTGPD